MRGPVLVTGANGFVGGHLVDLLCASGQLVFAWARPSATGVLPRLPVSTTAVDVLDAQAVHRALAALRPRVVFHCAGAAHVGESWHAARATLETNVRGTHHLLEADRRLRLQARILIPGSASVYRASSEPLSEESPLGPASPYGVSKLAQEQLALRAAAEGQQIVVTRSFNHLGPRQSTSYAAANFARQVALIEAGRLEPLIRTGNLSARRDLTDVRDTVRAYSLLADHGEPGIVYNVCSGAAVSMQDLLDRLCGRARARVRIQPDPALFRPHDAALVVGDNRRLGRATGWHPSIPLDRTLDDLLDYWRTRVSREAPPRSRIPSQQ
jgi:GDP-4-dehydro-6-deoxy-D-mannose reductase